MIDIATFLLARIAEDEGRRYAQWHDIDCPEGSNSLADCTCGSQARVLAECQAKRAIVEDVRGYCWEGRESGPPCGRCGRIGCRNLQLLASVYADHPDFREEWRA